MDLHQDIMVTTGLLVVTNVAKVSRLLSVARNHVHKTLYVQLYPQFRNPSHIPINSSVYTKAVTSIYSQAVDECKHIDVRVLLANLKNPKRPTITHKPIDIVLFDNEFAPSETTEFLTQYLNIDIPTIVLNESTNTKETFLEECSNSSTEEYIENCYNDVVLGGTFDRLHIGHKILLSNALLRCNKRVVVGVTDSNMIESKTLYELILPVAQRIEDINDFVMDVDPTLSYEIVPINDPFGPTKSDPDMQLIIVSEETLRGGGKVNEIRIQNGLTPLQIHCIELVEGGEAGEEGKEQKVSSSNQRINLLGTRLKDPVTNYNLPKKPYTIGLAGGIASGKTAITNRLHKLGAGIVNCDKIAHELYQPGKECHKLIKEHFGTRVFNEMDEVDRKELGTLVFGNKDELAKLNSLIWPAIINEARLRISELYEKQKYDVIIVEAAILLQAHWEKEFHEVWSCIIPPKEAIKRMQDRNRLTVDEAEARLKSQPHNMSYVSNSNVVFSTLWSPDCTQKQVEKAWSLLQKGMSKM